MQFGFLKDKGMTDAMFVVRQMQEKFRMKSKKLYFRFVDLEKAFERVLREVMKWSMRMLSVDEWLVSAVMSVYLGTSTVHGNSDHFDLMVGMHQGSALNPLAGGYIQRV